MKYIFAALFIGFLAAAVGYGLYMNLSGEVVIEENLRSGKYIAVPGVTARMFKDRDSDMVMGPVYLSTDMNPLAISFSSKIVGGIVGHKSLMFNARLYDENNTLIDEKNTTYIKKQSGSTGLGVESENNTIRMAPLNVTGDGQHVIVISASGELSSKITSINATLRRNIKILNPAILIALLIPALISIVIATRLD